MQSLQNLNGIDTFLLCFAFATVLVGCLYYFKLRPAKLNKDPSTALLKHGAIQQAIFDSANLSIIATNRDGIVQIYNTGAQRLLGYKSIDVIQKLSPVAIISAQDLKIRADQLSAEYSLTIPANFTALVYKSERVDEDNFETNKIRLDGTSVPVSVAVTALRSSDENIIGYLFIATDISAFKAAEAKQLALDKRINDLQLYTRSLIESNTDAIVTIDPHGDITDINRQMAALTGVSREDIIGSPFGDYFTEPQRAQAWIQQVLIDGVIRDYELTVKTKDGGQIAVSCDASTLYDADKNLLGVYAAARDITDRKTFEKTLENNNIDLKIARATADKANLAKSDFLSNMSHELRTPLNAVLGFAQLLASDMPPPSVAQQTSIDQITQAGWYLLRLINEILDLALIESGKVGLSQEALLLDEVLQECGTMIGPLAEGRSMTLQLPVNAEADYVLADRTRLKQVIFNLVSNAIKYGPRGSEVRVFYEHVAPDLIRISVTDTGAGLSPLMQSQLFQPFNRLGQQGNSTEGTGIGLVVTKRLVELMGGSIGVESEVNSGSTFWFELNTALPPKLVGESTTRTGLDTAQPKIEPARAEPPSPAQAPRWTLLYVEDNPANLVLVRQLMLRRSDIRLVTAIDGLEGVTRAKLVLPDLILMDINLPGMSGIEALAMLRSDLSTAAIPVIAVSANALSRDIERGLELGFFRYLTKPLNVREFMETIDLALKKITP